MVHANGHKTNNTTTKQINILTNQIIFIKTCHFIILSNIYILVTSVPSFHYSYNILNLTMFKTVSLLLVLVGVLNLSLPLLFSNTTPSVHSSSTNPSVQRSVSDKSLHTSKADLCSSGQQEFVLTIVTLLTSCILLSLTYAFYGFNQPSYIALVISTDNAKEQILIEAEDIYNHYPEEDHKRTGLAQLLTGGHARPQHHPCDEHKDEEL